MGAGLCTVWCAVTLVSLVGCSDGGGASATSTTHAASSSAVATPVVSSAPLTTTNGGESTSVPAGVPGLDDPDAFCAAWAAYSGTLQAISVAQAFGGLSSLAVARLEVIAAPALVESVGHIGGRWPHVLLEERSLALNSLIGPYGRRAEKALALLSAVGATDLDLQQFRLIWGAALRARRADQAVIALPPLSSELEKVVKAAALKLDAGSTPFGHDPSLDVHSVEVPLTKAYLARHCPDLASSGVGDAI